MKKLITAFTALALIGSVAWAQDIRFTQLNSNPLRVNPALMAPNYDLQFNLGYRTQWSTVGNGYNTAHFTYAMPVLMQDNGSKLDVGVTVLSDEAGAFSTFDGQLAVNYALKLSPSGHFLSAAIMAGYNQNQLSTDGLTFGDQYSAVNGGATLLSSEASIWADPAKYVDVSAGLLWYFNPGKDSMPEAVSAFAGASVFHINEPNAAPLSEGGAGRISKIPRRWTTIAGLKIYTQGKLDFAPQIRYDLQAGLREFSLGLYTGYTINEEMRAVLGIWYRDNQSFAFILGFNWKYFNLGYSYDLPSSNISAGLGNPSVHEITLGCKLDWASKKGVAFVKNPIDPY
ncbi:MAG: PorP/SprF family type IX secretion system membrane protein [Vicingaceae bacterium]